MTWRSRSRFSLAQFTEKDGREGWWVQLYIGGRRDNGGGVYGGFSKGVAMAKSMLKWHEEDLRKAKRKMTSPLPIGTIVKPWGEIIGVRTEGGEFGERYYFLKDKHGVISFMPAISIERSRSVTSNHETKPEKGLNG